MHQHLSRVWFCRQGTLVPLLLAIMFSLSGSNAVKKFFTEYLKPSATIHIGLKECPILRQCTSGLHKPTKITVYKVDVLYEGLKCEKKTFPI